MNSEAVQQIDLKLLIPTPDNPRFTAEPEALKSLAESIKANGVFQPAVVRPHPTRKGHFDLRCGHRRLVAAKLAGLETLPCIVRDLDDVQAMEVTISENMQREDLHPLEESLGVQRLLDLGCTTAAAAKRLGKSERWVSRRAQLTRLSPEWKKALRDGKSRTRELSGAALEEVAKLPAPEQNRWLEKVEESADWDRLQTAEELAEEITKELNTLASAPWDLEDEELVEKAGACANCPKRSSQQPNLWEDLPGKGKKGQVADRCLDRACWDGKHCALVQLRYNEAAKTHRGLKLYAGDTHNLPPAIRQDRNFKKLQLESYAFEKVGQGTTGAIPALVVDGSDCGKVRWFKKYSSAGSGGGGGKAPAVSAAEQVRRKRSRQILNDCITTLEEMESIDNELVKLGENPFILWPLIHEFLVGTNSDAVSVARSLKTPADKRNLVVAELLGNIGNSMRPTMVDSYEANLKLAAVVEKALSACGLSMLLAEHTKKAEEDFPMPAAAAKKPAASKKKAKKK